MVQAPHEASRSPQAGNGLSGLLLCPAAVSLGLAAVTLAVFWPVLGCDFTNYDDPAYFSENPRVLAGLSWANVRWALQATENSSWYPVTWLSFLLDATLFGKGPAGPHLTNLLLHAANSVLLFLGLRALTGKHWRSAMVAVLFALHPLRVEPVAWIAERKGLLSAFFALLTLGAYARHALAAAGRARAFRVGPWYVLALALFTLSLLSKPALVVLPCAMLLLDYWPLGRAGAGPAQLKIKALFPLALEKSPFLILGVLSSVATVRVHRQYGALVGLAASPLPERIGNALVSYARYLEKAFWPAGLALPYSDPGGWPLGAVLAAGL